jgi:hypothetical protein
VAIVDQQGGFYRYLTPNKYIDQRTELSAFNSLADVASETEDLVAVRNLYCGL